MNRTELVDAVASKTGLDKKHAEAAVAAVAESVMAETKSGSKVAIFGFGTFSPSARAARHGSQSSDWRTGADRGIERRPLRTGVGVQGCSQQSRSQEGGSGEEGRCQKGTG